MSADGVTFHARYITTDFDDGTGPGLLFDIDPREGTCRAYFHLLREIKKSCKNQQGLSWRVAARKLRPALEIISRNYWLDFDLDERKKSAHVKAEIKNMIEPLKATIKALETQPPFVRRGLNFQVATISGKSDDVGSDSFAATLALNKELLDACCSFVERKYRKEGGAVRFKHAARDLCAVWEDIFGRRFPRNKKTAGTTAREIKAGVRQSFENPAANFVFIAIREIGSPSVNGHSWVKASQVEEALASVFRGE